MSIKWTRGGCHPRLFPNLTHFSKRVSRHCMVTHPPSPLPQAMIFGGDSPSRAPDDATQDWHATAPTRILFIFVLATTCTKIRQEITHSLALTQHPCMQPHFTATSSPPTSLCLIAISVLAVNSLPRARRWASSQQLIRIAHPPHPHKPLH